MGLMQIIIELVYCRQAKSSPNPARLGEAVSKEKGTRRLLRAVRLRIKGRQTARLPARNNPGGSDLHGRARVVRPEPGFISLGERVDKLVVEVIEPGRDYRRNALFV